jgi:hypothetical protein
MSSSLLDQVRLYVQDNFNNNFRNSFILPSLFDPR